MLTWILLIILICAILAPEQTGYILGKLVAMMLLLIALGFVGLLLYTMYANITL